MAIEANLAEIVAACRDTVAASTVADTVAATDRRERAIRRLVHVDGIPASQVPYRAIQPLLAAGFTADQITGFGMTYKAVRAALRPAS